MTVYSLKNQCLSLCLEESRHGRRFFLNTRFSGFRTRVKLKSCCSLILAACDRQLGWATCPGSSVSQRRCVVPVINISDEINLENGGGGCRSCPWTGLKCATVVFRGRRNPTEDGRSSRQRVACWPSLDTPLHRPDLSHTGPFWASRWHLDSEAGDVSPGDYTDDTSPSGPGGVSVPPQWHVASERVSSSSAVTFSYS